jgi:hypothetical protein
VPEQDADVLEVLIAKCPSGGFLNQVNQL